MRDILPSLVPLSRWPLRTLGWSQSSFVSASPCQTTRNFSVGHRLYSSKASEARGNRTRRHSTRPDTAPLVWLFRLDTSSDEQTVPNGKSEVLVTKLSLVLAVSCAPFSKPEPFGTRFPSDAILSTRPLWGVEVWSTPKRSSYRPGVSRKGCDCWREPKI